MPLGDEHLWEYACQQDRHVFEEFGIGIVGIGALFFAYGQVVDDPYLQLLISFTGLGGSFILWMHIFGSLQERNAFYDLLRKNDQDFFKKFDDAQSWRTRGKFRLLYHPVTCLIQYFMLLVCWAWLTIILREIFSLDMIYLNMVFLVVALLYVGYRKGKDIKKRQQAEERRGKDRMAETARHTRQPEEQVKGECFQSLIRKHLKCTLLPSFLAVVIVLILWYLFVYVLSVFPVNLGAYDVEDLVGMGLQRQLSWGVVGLTLFFGFFQFLDVVHNRRNSSWLFKIVFVGFKSALTFSITKIADHYRWIAELERQGNMPILSTGYHEVVLYRLPIIVFFICLTLWFAFLCLFIERITRNT